MQPNKCLKDMKEFKTSKAEFGFILIDKLPNGITDVEYNYVKNHNVTVLSYRDPEAVIIPFHFRNLKGNWQLIGKLSEVSEEVAKGLVDDDEIYECYFSGFEKWIDIYKDYNNSEPMPYGVVFTATESLTSIATHLGMELTDNIYLLKKI